VVVALGIAFLRLLALPVAAFSADICFAFRWVKRMTWLQMYTGYTRGSKGWHRTTHAAVPPNGGFRFAATASATTADEDRRWLGPEVTEKACKTPGSSHQLLIGSGVQPA
jgi:hypothetical protein